MKQKIRRVLRVVIGVPFGIGKKIGVSEATVSRAYNGKSWAHLLLENDFHLQ